MKQRAHEPSPLLDVELPNYNGAGELDTGLLQLPPFAPFDLGINVPLGSLAGTTSAPRLHPTS